LHRERSFHQPVIIASVVRTYNNVSRVKDPHPSARYIHCSIWIKGTQNHARNTDALEEFDIFKHYVQLLLRVKEVSGAGPDHGLWITKAADWGIRIMWLLSVIERDQPTMMGRCGRTF
jgi:hypothetical protein